MADPILLDTSAILSLTGDEPGAEEVQSFIDDALPVGSDYTARSSV